MSTHASPWDRRRSSSGFDRIRGFVLRLLSPSSPSPCLKARWLPFGPGRVSDSDNRSVVARTAAGASSGGSMFVMFAKSDVTDELMRKINVQHVIFESRGSCAERLVAVSSSHQVRLAYNSQLVTLQYHIYILYYTNWGKGETKSKKRASYV